MYKASQIQLLILRIGTLGQVLITQPAIGTNELNISKLAMGVYTVRFNGVSQKLVIR
jgi:hypothetical protein